MDDSDWNNDFDENFDAVLKASVSSSTNRFFSKSPVKETLQDRLDDKFKKSVNLNSKDAKKTFITLEDFNNMKRQEGDNEIDKIDEQRTLSKDNYVDGFDDIDQLTIKPGDFRLQAPMKKKSLRFLNAFDEKSDVEEDFEILKDFNFEISPSKRTQQFYTPKRMNNNPDTIHLASSPSRSNSSSVSLSSFSETDYTDDEEFIEGFELNNNISLLKQYQMRKERALHQAQIEYDNLMKYNSLLNKKLHSTGNIARLRNGPFEEDEDFMDGFDGITTANFQRPKRPLQQPTRNKVKHSQSSYTLRTRPSLPGIGGMNDVPTRRLKHSASNYFDVHTGSSSSSNNYQDPLSRLGNGYAISSRYGKGHELDDIDDLTEIPDETLTNRDKKSIRKLIDLANYMEVYNDKNGARKSISSRSNKSPSKRSSRKMGLIKQLNNADTERVYHNNQTGDMKYNPRTYRWEGNEVDLGKFDNMPQRPSLINNTSSLHTITKKKLGQQYQIVGNMVFNPEKMCWTKMGSDKDEQDEEDPFKGLDDLQEEEADNNDNNNRRSVSNKRPQSSRGASASTVMTASSMAESNRLHDIDEEETDNDDPFNLSREMISKFKHEEQKWNKKVRNWFQPGEADNRDYLYEIKRMVTDNV